MDVKGITRPAETLMDINIQQGLKFNKAAADKGSNATKKVAREFEAMFVGMMLKSMRDTTKTNRLTGGGHGEEAYSSLQDQEYARIVAENGGLGLAAFVEKQLMGKMGDAKPASSDRRGAMGVAFPGEEQK